MGIVNRCKLFQQLNKKTNTHEKEEVNLKVLSETEEEEFINWFNSYIKRRRESLTEEESSSHFIEGFSYCYYPNYDRRFEKVRVELKRETTHSPVIGYNDWFDKAEKIVEEPYNKLLKSAGWHIAELAELMYDEYVLAWNVEDMDSTQHTKLITAKDMKKYDTRDTKGLCNFLIEYYKKVQSGLSQTQKRDKYFSILVSDVPVKYTSTKHNPDSFTSCYLEYLSDIGITVDLSCVTVLGNRTKYLNVYYGKSTYMSKELFRGK